MQTSAVTINHDRLIKKHMNAVVITSFGEPSVLKVLQRPTPKLLDNEVLVHVKAAGVNRPDIFQRMGNYPPPEGITPDIPGLEISGIVENVGKNVSRWKTGDAVCALIGGGGYADFVNVNEGHCLPIPSGFSFTEAAGLPETIFTVWHNVFQRGRLKRGERLLIHGGSSGIGTTAIQLAKAIGAHVTVTTGNEEKGEKCLSLGADHYINYKKADFEQESVDRGFDVILDMIGGDYFNKNMNILLPDGRLVYINAMAGNQVSLNVMKMMQKRITITGSTLRSRNAEFKTELAKTIYKEVWPLLEKGQFKPVIFRTFNLADAHQAHVLMESSHHIGKLILVNN